MKRPLTIIALVPALALFAIAQGCSGGGSSQVRSEPRPNVVFVVVDTLRADHTTLGGYLRDTTPQLASHFENGTVFQAASSSSSWTLPSMAMMFTGAYRLANDGDIGTADKPIAEAFQAAGYRTGAVVANPLLGPYRKKDSRTKETIQVDPGFGRGFAFFDAHTISREHQKHNWYAEEVARRGVTWVDSEPENDAPFFLWLHMFDPHFPRIPALAGSLPPLNTTERSDAYKMGIAPSEEHLFNDEAYRYIESETAKYDEEVAGVDAAMGGLFRWLEQTGRAENTIVVFTSDHGEGLWNRARLAGEPDKKSNSFTPLYDDHGVQVYSEQVHVPLALSGPGVAKALRVRDSVSLVDLAPTLYQLCDLPFEPLHGGLSLVEEGRFTGVQAGPSEVFSVCSRSISLTLDGRWRLHLPAEYRMRDHGVEPELFDLAADPGELTTLDDPERIAAMSARIVSFRTSLEERAVMGGGRSAAEDAARRELLDALGYIDQ